MRNENDFLLFFIFIYDIQHCFICRPSDSTVLEDAGIELWTVAITALAVRRSNHSARSHPLRNDEHWRKLTNDKRERWRKILMLLSLQVSELVTVLN